MSASSGPIQELRLGYMIRAIDATLELLFPPRNSAEKLGCGVYPRFLISSTAVDIEMHRRLDFWFIYFLRLVVL